MPRLKLPSFRPAICAMALLLALPTAALAQNSPGPGPTNPVPPFQENQPGLTMVINPTIEECRRGWNETVKWTREEFQKFCNQLGASK